MKGKYRKIRKNDVMARAKPFFPGEVEFNIASVKNNHNNEKKYFECSLGCMVRNITGRATTPDTTVPLRYYFGLLIKD